jgi:hypothetical protein
LLANPEQMITDGGQRFGSADPQLVLSLNHSDHAIPRIL